MMREKLEKIEMEILAPYAIKSGESRGRRYPEPRHPYRTEFQRDRDRIVHSTAFRRLQYKTQVFVNHEGDHYRTRLTHTMEVGIISRTVARALRLNEDLAEAVALAHDLGHTPFGHSGEEALDEILSERGGFEHNRQCLRVIDLLESRYPEFPGLNLTYELREGILKHHSEDSWTDIPADLRSEYGPSLEAQVVNIADEIAYNCHDVDDGLSSGILSESVLDDLPVWREGLKKLTAKYPDPGQPMRRHHMVRFLINRLTTDLIENSRSIITADSPSSAEDIRTRRRNLIKFSDDVNRENAHLKDLLNENLYKNERLLLMSSRAREIVKGLFRYYEKSPAHLPEHILAKFDVNSPESVITDYIAGMTDRFASAEYEKMAVSSRD